MTGAQCFSKTRLAQHWRAILYPCISQSAARELQNTSNQIAILIYHL
jgi:hypothetical protein